jgi:hypothetical protein
VRVTTHNKQITQLRLIINIKVNKLNHQDKHHNKEFILIRIREQIVKKLHLIKHINMEDKNINNIYKMSNYNNFSSHSLTIKRNKL